MKLSSTYAFVCPRCKRPGKKGDTIIWTRQFGLEMCRKCYAKGEPTYMEKIWKKTLDKD